MRDDRPDLVPIQQCPSEPLVVRHANVREVEDLVEHAPGLLEIVTAIAGIATAVVLFPIVKRQSEATPLATSRLVSLNRPSSSWAS